MTPEQFCYWLQGFIELQDADDRGMPPGLTEQQRAVIKDHLALVFNKVTPDRSKKKQVLSEEKKPASVKELIKELQRRPGVTCNPFDPYPGRIC